MRGAATQEDLRYHVGTATLGKAGAEVPVIMLLSHAWGQAVTQHIVDMVLITCPKARGPDGICTDWVVPPGYLDPRYYWPQHQGPVTCVLSQVYEPKRPRVDTFKVPSDYMPPAGKLVEWQSKAAQLSAVYLPTG